MVWPSEGVGGGGGFALDETRSDRHVHALQYIGRMGSCKDGNCLSVCLSVSVSDADASSSDPNALMTY